MNKLLLVLGLTALAFVPLRTGESAVRPLDMADLAKESTLIVRGTIKSQQVHFQDDSRGQLIVTDHQVKVGEILKGRLPEGADSFLLETEGGRIGQLVCRSWEEPTVADGEEVILYLAPSVERPGVWRCFGAFQGKLTLLGGRLREERERTWEDYRGELRRHLDGRGK